MTKGHIVARRQKAAAKAIQRRWRQNFIDDNIDKPGRFEGMYKKPTLVVRRIKGDH